jgi:DNA polymerase epsilon subunit 1
MTVRLELSPVVAQNKLNKDTQEAYDGWYNEAIKEDSSNKHFLSKILDIREYDVPYHIRVAIDKEIRCSFWYEFTLDGPVLKHFQHLKEKLDKADLRVMAFDIETTKAPLKFPDVRFDQIMMISYIVDGCGFLITNREVVGSDVQDFEYAPRPEFDVGTFTVFNEPNE